MTGAENAAQIALQQCHAPSFHRHIRTCTHGNADVSLGERGRIVHSISGHRDHRAILLVPFDYLCLLLRQHVGLNSMPSLSATAFAVVALSPVTMMIFRPAARNSRIASGGESLTGSDTPTKPPALPSTATSITVWPSLRRASALSSKGAGSRDSSR